MPPAAILDVDFSLSLVSPGRRFDLHVAFQSQHLRTALLGPSGSGKSATLQVIAGLLKPDHGHIRVNGQALLDTRQGILRPARQRGIGLVFQDYALFPHMTVAQNILFALRRMGQPSLPQHAERVAALLAQFKIDSLSQAYPRHLSGGQKQRVALARAVANDPALLLLDEPLSALDTQLRHQLREELADMLDKIRIPSLLVTHDPQDVAQLAQSVVNLSHGQVSEVQTLPQGHFARTALAV